MSVKFKIEPDHEKLDELLVVLKADEIQEYKKWAKKIPPLNFPEDWNVQIIPPFGGAVVRFVVTRDDTPGKSISVYLDCYSRLGAMDRPYWEIYPNHQDDTNRYFMEETDELIYGIDRALGNRRKKLTKS